MAIEQADLTQQWLEGQISLGAAAEWNKDEIRIISEIAYSLAQQGRYAEAVVIFEGLLAIAPATAYFQAALGALQLRLKNTPKAIEHLSAALKIEETDVVSLVNRGEAYLLSGSVEQARADLEKALQIAAQRPKNETDINNETTLTVKRARTLLQVHKV
jgi:tetratricopeptide (TPR) repeat protein